MTGALAEYAVKAQSDEQGNQGEDDDDGQCESYVSKWCNIVRLW
jgi:hypothetical protein